MCGLLAVQSGPVIAGSGGGSSLAAVGMAGGSSWAVGTRYDASLRAHQTLIEQFTGTGWSIVPSPNASALNNGFNDISVNGVTAWAVGYGLQQGPGSPAYQPLAARFDGSQWVPSSPVAPAGDAVLTGVDALADGTAWAVGFQTTSGGVRRTLVEHVADGAWTTMASPNDGTPSTRDNTLMAISGTAATGLWAVGYRQSPTGLRALVLRYDTAASSPAWVSVSGAGAVPSPGKVDTVLTAVDVRSASDVWAVGYYDHGSGERPLSLHWNGASWSISWVPGVGMLRRVRAVSAGDVWAVGTYWNPTEHRTKTLLVHFTGGGWATALSADPAPPSANQLTGLAVSPDGSSLMAVGSQGPATLAERATCATGPVTLASRTPLQPLPPPTPPTIGPAPTPPLPTPPPTTAVPVTFTDQAATVAIGEDGAVGHTWSAAVADFNGDGHSDVFVSHHGDPGRLWITQIGGTFTEIDQRYFSGLDRHDCEALDANRDGLVDLFCSVGADRGTGLKSNALYLQNADHTFSDQAYQWAVSDPEDRGRYSTILDANNDGYPDVFSGSASLRPDGLPAPNRLFLNAHGTSTLDSPTMGLDLNIGSGCAHTVDYNADGWPDLLVCGRSDTTATALHLYQNLAGHGFSDVSSLIEPPVPAEDALLVDVNHDNRPDLITLTLRTVAERLQNADGTFAPAQTLLAVSGGRSLAIGDVNGDHNPDIYVTNGKTASLTNAPDSLLIGNATGRFTSQPIPQTSLGQGDHAYPIDYNGDGLSDFLVLNGRDQYQGPIQLITPRPVG
jgi:hypothetical protein